MTNSFLIIEDNNMWINALSRTIQERFDDALITCVTTVEHALIYLSRERFDVIISDMYEFDDLSGKAFETILKTSKSPQTPVIFISSHAAPEDVFKAAKLGAFDFMVIERLNFSIDQLVSSIETALKMRNTPKVFISYSSSDRKFVKRLAEALQSLDVRVWWDSWEIKVGDSITKKIEEGIASSSSLIVVLSPNSVSSRWVQEELDAALIKQIADRDIRILPVLKADCVIPLLLRSRKYADFRKTFKSGIEDLYKTITIA